MPSHILYYKMLYLSDTCIATADIIALKPEYLKIVAKVDVISFIMWAYCYTTRVILARKVSLLWYILISIKLYSIAAAIAISSCLNLTSIVIIKIFRRQMHLNNSNRAKHACMCMLSVTLTIKWFELFLGLGMDENHAISIIIIIIMHVKLKLLHY